MSHGTAEAMENGLHSMIQIENEEQLNKLKNLVERVRIEMSDTLEGALGRGGNEELDKRKQEAEAYLQTVTELGKKLQTAGPGSIDVPETIMDRWHEEASHDQYYDQTKAA